MFSNYGAPTWQLSPSSRRPPTTTAMAYICAPRTLPVKWQGCLYLALQRTIVRRMSVIICLTNCLLDKLDANFAVKIYVHAVYETCPLRTPAFFLNPALSSYRAVKPLAFKWDPKFIQIRCLFEEIRQNSELYQLVSQTVVNRYTLFALFLLYTCTCI